MMRISLIIKMFLKFNPLYLFSFLFLTFHSSPVLAICPHPEPRVQTLLTRCDAGFIGTVISFRCVIDKNGNGLFDNVTGTYFTFRVEKTFVGPEEILSKFMKITTVAAWVYNKAINFLYLLNAIKKVSCMYIVAMVLMKRGEVIMENPCF